MAIRTTEKSHSKFNEGFILAFKENRSFIKSQSTALFDSLVFALVVFEVDPLTASLEFLQF
jgi:hypothetical protein